MYRVVLCVAATLIAFGMAAAPARADDTDTCDKATGDNSIAACSRLIQQNPKNAAAYYDRGIAFYHKHDYDRAISDYDQAIRLNPKNADAYTGRGIAFYHKHDYDRAISDYDQAIRLDPKDAKAYYGRGIAYDDKGDYDRAISDYDQAIRLDPKDAKAYCNRGIAYDNKGDYDRAISDYDQAIRLDPKLALAYYNRGLAYKDKGDYDRAISDYDHAIRLDPKDADAYGDRGLAFESKGDYARAIADYDQSLRLDLNNTFAREGRERVRAALAARPSPTRPQQALIPQPPPQDALAVLLPQAKPPAALSQPASPPERRVALVIGMSAYANVAPLPNPASDARAVADAFRRLGFAEVTEREDLTRAKMEEALKGFGDKAAAADWAVIYYAGHGVEMNGVNYLVPVDAKLARADHVEDETVTLTRVLSKAEPARKLRMVILDACRNNPFRLASAEGRPRAVGRGLSPIEPMGGVLVAYAARGGTMADDGGGGHSPFTQALLTHLETPGVDIRIMFSKVRDSVLVRTNNTQEPFTYGSLPGQEFYFRPAGR